MFFISCYIFYFTIHTIQYTVKFQLSYNSNHSLCLNKHIVVQQSRKKFAFYFLLSSIYLLTITSTITNNANTKNVAHSESNRMNFH